MSQSLLQLSPTDVESDSEYLQTPVDMPYDYRSYPYQIVAQPFCHSPEPAGGSRESSASRSSSLGVVPPHFYHEGSLPSSFDQQSRSGRVDPYGADSLNWQKHGYQNFLSGQNGKWVARDEYQEEGLPPQQLSPAGLYPAIPPTSYASSFAQSDQTVGRRSATGGNPRRACRVQDGALDSSYPQSEPSHASFYPSHSTLSDSPSLVPSAGTGSFVDVAPNAQLPTEAYTQYYSNSSLAHASQHATSAGSPDVSGCISESSYYTDVQDHSLLHAYSQAELPISHMQYDDSVDHSPAERWAAGEYDQHYPYPQPDARYPLAPASTQPISPPRTPQHQRHYNVALHNSPPCPYSYPRFTETGIHAPQPQAWPMLPPSALGDNPSAALLPIISAPLPPRSPPLIEDAPKRPLTLACLFCRKRKIACGSPPPGKKDRTCNQCARRNLKCVYPDVSRRGMRPKLLYDKDSISVPVMPPLPQVPVV